MRHRAEIRSDLIVLAMKSSLARSGRTRRAQRHGRDAGSEANPIPRAPAEIDRNSLTVNEAGPPRQRRRRGDDLRGASCKIVAVAGEQPDAVALAPRPMRKPSCLIP